MYRICDTRSEPMRSVKNRSYIDLSMKDINHILCVLFANQSLPAPIDLFRN